MFIRSPRYQVADPIVDDQVLLLSLPHNNQYPHRAGAFFTHRPSDNVLLRSLFRTRNVRLFVTRRCLIQAQPDMPGESARREPPNIISLFDGNSVSERRPSTIAYAVGLGRFGLFSFIAFQRSAKCATAACRRDFTVPRGISRISLICL